MITFNLGQADRVSLHKRIASGALSGTELARLDSTALANETTQAEIAAMAAESLAQTILVRTNAPRAKLTHKGMVDIEMDDLPNADERVKEDHKLDEENQREAERLARVRPARKSSMSIPPESPITPTTPSFSQWGAPPPLPAHAFGPNGSGTPSIFDMPSSTGEMALGDLIHLDDEPGFFDENVSIPQSLDHGSLSGLSSSVLQLGIGTNVADSTSFQQSGGSPLLGDGSNLLESPSSAARFDLSALWGGQAAPASPSAGLSASVQRSTARSLQYDGPSMEMDLGDDDDAFDMFLRDDDDGVTPEDAPEQTTKAQTPPPLPSIESKPQVWFGHVSASPSTT
jgi:hypothetical protein